MRVLTLAQDSLSTASIVGIAAGAIVYTFISVSLVAKVSCVRNAVNVVVSSLHSCFLNHIFLQVDAFFIVILVPMRAVVHRRRHRIDALSINGAEPPALKP